MTRFRRRTAAAWAAILATACAVTAPAGAEDSKPAVLLEVEASPDLAAIAAEVDAYVAAALADLDYDLDPAGGPDDIAEERVVGWARQNKTTVVRASLHKEGPSSKRFELVIEVARPGEPFVRRRTMVAPPAELELKTLVSLRDLLSDVPRQRRRRRRARFVGTVDPERRKPSTTGAAILATNGTLYGGFLGYSIQRASQSEDPRLLYPLVAVGAGLGLGASLIAVDEWDVSAAESWFIVAGSWWPTAAMHLIHAGRFSDSRTGDEAWTYGLIGSVTGISLATVGLLPREMKAGGTVLAHSGGGLGVAVGGLVDFGISGSTEGVPLAGMGYGAAGGWLLASSSAMLFEPRAKAVLIVDLGFLLGGLAGASAASPLLLEDPTADEVRGWVGAAGGGAIAGGVVSLFFLPD
ncbi:MAG: hypothetical protein AAGA56_05800, partial [Myxococcota bacterium]